MCGARCAFVGIACAGGLRHNLEMATASGKDPTKPSVDIVTFSSCSVLDSQGQKIKLGQLWQKQTVVFIFLRHFGCIACRGHALQVWKDRERYENSGAKIVFIGNGLPTYIEKFREELALEGAMILTDPTLLSFRAAGFRHGFLALVQPKSAINVVKLLASGVSNDVATEETGTNWQLGGIVVVKPNGLVAYHYISEALGDYPPAADVPSTP